MTTQSLTHWTAVQFVSALDSSVSGALANVDALSELYAYDTCSNAYPCNAEQVEAMVSSDDGEAPCLSRNDIDWTGYDAANAIAAQSIGECAYCGRSTTERNVPVASDDAAWLALADEHSANCEWIETRAHRQ